MGCIKKWRMVIKNNRGQSNNGNVMFVVVLIIVAVFVILSYSGAFSQFGDNTEEDFNTALELEEGTTKKDEDVSTYDSSNTTLANSVETETSLSDADGNYEVIDSNTIELANGSTYNYDRENIHDVLGFDLDTDEEVIRKFWVNSNHSLGNLEMIAVENIVSGKWTIYYKIGDDTRKISNLKEAGFSDIKETYLLNTFENRGFDNILKLYENTDTNGTQIGNFHLNNNSAEAYNYTYLVKTSKSLDSLKNTEDLTSLVILSNEGDFGSTTISQTNDFKIYTEIENTLEDISLGIFNYSWTYMTSQKEESYSNQGGGTWTTNLDGFKDGDTTTEYMSIDEINKYRTESISQLNSRNVNKVGYLTKLVEGYGRIDEKDIRLFREEDYQKAFDVNKERYNSFLSSRFGEKVQSSGDYVQNISFNGTEYEFTEGELEGVIITNKSEFDNVQYGTTIESGLITMEEDRYLNFFTNDNGLTYTISQDYEGELFGNLLQDFTIQFTGVANLQEEQGWEDYLELAFDLLIRDYESFQDNAVDQIGNPLLANEGSNTLLGFAGSSTFEGNTTGEVKGVGYLEIKEGFGIDNSFTYEGNTYHTFNTLQSTDDKEVCVITQRTVNTTGNEIPVSLCDEDISMIGTENDFRIVAK